MAGTEGRRTAVVTGVSAISPVGIGRDNYWNALRLGTTAFAPISLFDVSPFPVRIAGEVRDFDPVPFLGKKGLRDLDRSARLVCSAAGLALEDARLAVTEENTHSMGVSVGATFGSLHSISQFDRQGLIEGPRFVNPSHFPNTVLNSPASRVSIRFQIKGFNTTISTGFCASLDALCYAADFIKMGRAAVVLAGGVEELCEETFIGFNTLGFLSGSDGSEPLCCPFDLRRNGILLSEGSAILVLEDEGHALERRADILAVVKGYGNAFDPITLSAPGDFNHSWKGLTNAIRLALKDASLSPENIDLVSASANSTKGLDKMETAAIREVFDSRAPGLPVSAVKSMIGESFSASGALSMAAAVGALVRGFIPPTVNYSEKDPACDLDYVPNAARQERVNNVLVISSDPFGNNTAIVVGRQEG